MSVQIPVTNDYNQSFTVSLPKATGNISLDFFFAWNRIANYWQMNITDSASQKRLISGLPVLKGLEFYANLLAQYQYLDIGGLFVIPISITASDSPGETDWDSNFVLIWGDV